MLNALLIGNPDSASGRHLAGVRVPGRWVTDPSAVTPGEVRHADLVALFGGDGTMQITLSRILDEMGADELPPIALLPFGTTNMNAADINRARRRKAAVASLDRAVRSGRLEILRRPLVRIQDSDHTRHGFFLGTGVIATVIDRWNTDRSPAPFLNQLRSIRAMATGLRSVSASHAIELDGQPRRVYGLIATTLHRLLFGATPFWGAAEGGPLRLTWIDAEARGLLRHAPALLRGRPSLAAEPGYESRSSCRSTLTIAGPYVVDGEVFPAPGGPLIVEPSDDLRWARL